MTDRLSQDAVAALLIREFGGKKYVFEPRLETDATLPPGAFELRDIRAWLAREGIRGWDVQRGARPQDLLLVPTELGSAELTFGFGVTP